jgi:5-formyltetrahydrofolate cyclo-ligase
VASVHAEPGESAKRQVRTRMLAARRERTDEEQGLAAELIAQRVVDLVEAQGARTVCAYISLAGEPGTWPLIRRLHSSQVRILLPVMRPDFDLDWAEYSPGEFRPGPRGMTEPNGPPLGVTGIQSADLIVCPGVAGSRVTGARLGRGGGSYDRALARALPNSLRCLLLYEDEVVDEVPTLNHDEYVDVIVTPDATLRVSAARRG